MRDRAVVVDASVAAKWYFDEPGSAAAVQLLDDPRIRLTVPDLWYLELGCAIWKRARRDPRVTSVEVALLEAQVRRVPVTVRPSAELLGRALVVALEADVSVYDAAYAATTELSEATLVTADVVLYRRLRAWQAGFRVELLT